MDLLSGLLNLILGFNLETIGSVFGIGGELIAISTLCVLLGFWQLPCRA